MLHSIRAAKGTHFSSFFHFPKLTQMNYDCFAANCERGLRWISPLLFSVPHYRLASPAVNDARFFLGQNRQDVNVGWNQKRIECSFAMDGWSGPYTINSSSCFCRTGATVELIL